MAARTGERATLPEAQAEPDESATPGEIERHQRRRGVEPRNGEAQGVGQARARRRRTRRGRARRRAGPPRCRRAGPRAGPRTPGSARSAATPSPTMPGRFSVPPRRRPSWPPPRRKAASRVDALGEHQGADALGGAELVARQGQGIEAEGRHVEGDLADRLDRVRVHQGPAMGPGQGHDRRQRLDHAGLVVGGMDRDQHVRVGVPGEQGLASAPRSIRPARVHRDARRPRPAGSGGRPRRKGARWRRRGGASAPARPPAPGRRTGPRWPPRCRRS